MIVHPAQKHKTGAASRLGLRGWGKRWEESNGLCLVVQVVVQMHLWPGRGGLEDEGHGLLKSGRAKPISHHVARDAGGRSIAVGKQGQDFFLSRGKDGIRWH
jgi:hypothetical protein